jgi:hypothetical protein
MSGRPRHQHQVRATLFRGSHRGEGIDDTATIEGARQIVLGQPPGRYDVDEIRSEPMPSGHTSRAWGQLIRHPDGRVEEELHPCPDRCRRPDTSLTSERPGRYGTVTSPASSASECRK